MDPSRSHRRIHVINNCERPINVCRGLTCIAIYKTVST